LSSNATSPLPAAWPVEELDACFVVRDHNGQALGYAYFEDELSPGGDRPPSCSARMRREGRQKGVLFLVCPLLAQSRHRKSVR
jgi:hypothetical protein